MGLPYFNFFAMDWIAGRIQDYDMETQGIFINLCAHYWKNDCDLTSDIDILSRRLRIDKQSLSNAIAMLQQSFLRVDSNATKLRIKFLDEQHQLLFEKHEKRVNAGRKGGNIKALSTRSNATAMLKQCCSIQNQNQNQNQNQKEDTQGYITSHVVAFPREASAIQKEAHNIGYPMSLETAEKFLAHYESMGWTVNGNPIRNWKSLLTKWRLNESNFNGNSQPKKIKKADQNKDYSM